MKKYFYVAIMALTLGMFVGCTGTSIGQAPDCDDQAGTINGKPYNNTDYACWEITADAVMTCNTGDEDGDEVHLHYLDWCTEYEAQKTKAEFDFENNWSSYVYGYGCSSKGSCTIKKTDHTQDECYSSNL